MRMIRVLFIFLLAGMSYFFVTVSPACISPDQIFMVTVNGLSINTYKLNEACEDNSCNIKAFFQSGRAFKQIVFRSHYDKKVAVVVTNSMNSKAALALKLPYRLDKKNVPTVAELDPKKFNWPEAMKTELIYLKKIGVLKIEDADIDTISPLAGSGRNIIFCGDKWQVGDGCRRNGEVTQTNCISDDLAEQPILPIFMLKEKKI